jgi:hypothetical protein
MAQCESQTHRSKWESLTDSVAQPLGNFRPLNRFSTAQGLPPSSGPSSEDRRALGTRGAHARLSLFSALEIPCLRAGSLDALSCKFALPSVPPKTGGIGWNISGNGFCLVGLI